MPERREDGSKTVLIVEDDAGSILRLRELFTRRGFLVRQVSSRQEARDVLATGRSELIIVDIEKPHLEGQQILTALRADERNKHLTVIAFAAGATAEQRAQGLRWGADDCISQSVGPEELDARIDVWLQISRLRRETLFKNRALSALSAMAATLGHSLNLKEVLEQALGQILDLMELDAGLVRLSNNDKPEFRICVGNGVFVAQLKEAGSAGPCEEFAGIVAQSEKPVLIPDVPDAPGVCARLRAIAGVRAVAGIPLVSKHRVVGTMSLFWQHPRAFSREEERLLASIGYQISVTVENARLYTALQQRADRLAAVNRLTRAIGASFGLNEVYQTFATEVGRLVHCDRMGLVLRDDSDHGFKLLRLTADRPAAGEPESVSASGSGTCIEWVMSQQRPHLEPNLAESRQFVEDEALLKAGIRSAVRLPLIANGKAIGILCLGSTTPSCYGEQELEILVPLSEQLAIAIEHGRLFQEIHRLAITDELTGLFNHRHFYRQLEQECRRTRRYGHPLSLIMLDIDLFKQYNDLNGHLAGDEALRLIAALLRNSTRGVDIAARYGGDEFGIILPETDLRQAWVQAERIRFVMERDALGERGASGSQSLTASLGVACLGPDMRQAEDLVRAADQALYRSKAAGGNRTSVA